MQETEEKKSIVGVLERCTIEEERRENSEKRKSLKRFLGLEVLTDRPEANVLNTSNRVIKIFFRILV